MQGPLALLEPLDQGLQPLHIGQAAEVEGVLAHAGNAEVVTAAAGGQHQPAIGDLAARVGLKAVAGAIDLGDPIPQPGHAPAGQQGVVAGGYLPAAQFTAEQFVEQGQEQEPFLGLD